MNQYIKKTLAVMAMLMVSMAAMSQQVVTGTVVDESGNPVIGATIVSTADKRNGVVTDINGKFKISVPAKAKIRVSYIGYETRILPPVDNQRIQLREDNSGLEEVVVVGYGSMKQKNVTGAVEVINPEELKDLNVTSLSEALAGISPSIHVDMPSTGRPGETATITIRQAKDAVSMVPTGKDQGGNPIGGDATATPLYVIDDFITTEEEFNNLDIDEVESISKTQRPLSTERTEHTA